MTTRKTTENINASANNDTVTINATNLRSDPADRIGPFNSFLIRIWFS
jgi:hypothetical protein